MRQEEFLMKLQETLTGKVSDRIIQENVTYYRNYINNEIRNGKSEEEVLRVLGDPRLLAKTIEESNKYANGDESYAYDNNAWGFQGNRNGQNTQEQGTNVKRSFQVKGLLALLVGVVILVLVIGLIGSILSFFAPFLLIIAGAILVYRVITGGNGRSY